MRPAYSYQKCLDPDRFRNTIDSTAEEFSESLLVSERLKRLHTWADFERIFSGISWVKEFHRLLVQVLVKQRRTLSIGSCFGENEAPFIKDGYDIVCSDINTAVIAHMRQYFPPSRYQVFDLFSSTFQDFQNNFQDLLITGLDYAFDDVQTVEIFRNCRALLAKSTTPGEKRLLFSLRYHDNWVTKLIDKVLLPAESGLKNIVMKGKGSKTRYIAKFHGFRRSRNEIIAIALAEGFALRRTLYGGYGVELERSSVVSRLKFLTRVVTNIDPHIRLFNNITIFEFVAA
ncbi:MAG: hypothetical protein JWR21_3770 [Herminiimonas sp.]|nr:hypothetical protein [Herminiimonas sp.]